MEVLIVSGFLGAGKTTFIRELIARTEGDLAVLENEFGSIDLDSELVARSAPGRVVGLADGCACCARKGEFIGSLLTISASIDPDYLIVEPSGIGKLGNLIANVKMASYERISLLRTIVVACPRTLEENLARFGDVCEDQLANADVVVFSKVESEDAAVVERAARTVSALNPDARIVRDHYSRQPGTWWRGLLEGGARTAAVRRVEVRESSVEEVTVEGGRLASIGALAMFCEQLVRGAFGQVVRGKGTLRAGGGSVRLELSDGRYSLRGADDDAPRGCVFIGSSLDRAALLRALGPNASVVRAK